MSTRRVLNVTRALSVLALVAACGGSPRASAESFPDAPYTSASAAQIALELRTAPAQPPERGESSMQLRVRDRGGKPLDGLKIDVVVWMPGHGHGSHVTPRVTAEGEGAYRLDDVVFTMPGAWELLVDARADGMQDSASLRIDVH